MSIVMCDYLCFICLIYPTFIYISALSRYLFLSIVYINVNVLFIQVKVETTDARYEEMKNKDPNNKVPNDKDPNDKVSEKKARKSYTSELLSWHSLSVH